MGFSWGQLGAEMKILHASDALRIVLATRLVAFVLKSNLCPIDRCQTGKVNLETNR